MNVVDPKIVAQLLDNTEKELWKYRHPEPLIGTILLYLYNYNSLYNIKTFILLMDRNINVIFLLQSNSAIHMLKSIGQQNQTILRKWNTNYIYNIP